jgi:hypothetical protein
MKSPSTYRDTPVFRICLFALACAMPPTQAASLFGDHSCLGWQKLDYAKKKNWANAFLAPLSLTYQGLQRTGPDKYNDDAKGFESAILSIDDFCLAHPELEAADGAAAYLSALVGR